MMEIQRERVEVLCAALESGRYQQGQSALRNNAGYCCLGVACDVSNVSRWSALPVGVNGSFSYGPLGEVSYLPTVVADWYGFVSKNPVLMTPSGGYRSMSSMNDDHGYSFKQIAEALRRTYLIGDGTTDDGGSCDSGE